MPKNEYLVEKQSFEGKYKIHVIFEDNLSPKDIINKHSRVQHLR